MPHVITLKQSRKRPRTRYSARNRIVSPVSGGQLDEAARNLTNDGSAGYALPVGSDRDEMKRAIGPTVISQDNKSTWMEKGKSLVPDSLLTGQEVRGSRLDRTEIDIC